MDDADRSTNGEDPDAEVDPGTEVDPDAEVTRADYDWSSTSPSVAVIEAIAVLEDVTPLAVRTELETSLYEHVDPGALDAILDSDRGYPVTVTFTVDDYTVRLESHGLLVVYLTG